MTRRHPLIRWIPTFLAFPLAGLVTVATVGPLTSPVAGALGGLLAGAVVGGAQWLALRGLGVGRAWWLATAAATSLGTALGVALTGAGTSTGELALRGLVTGAVVGLGQAIAVRRPALPALAWTVTSSAAWGIGWWVTSRVIVDAERGYTTFGSSGALLATLLTGAALPLVLGRRTPVAGTDAADAAAASDAAVAR
jgi:hypothetical protein